jgi:5-methylthioadenosine/S-adenosylhomocysteine deaminase
MATMIWPPTPQVPAPRQVDIPVDVGTDEAASNDSQNMLEAAKAAAMLQKLTGLDARP